jgi:hypothetical protein
MTPALSTDLTNPSGFENPIDANGSFSLENPSNFGTWQAFSFEKEPMTASPKQVPLEGYTQQQLAYPPPPNVNTRRGSISCMVSSIPFFCMSIAADCCDYLLVTVFFDICFIIT